MLIVVFKLESDKEKYTIVPLRYLCPCGFVYREDSAHGTICPESKHPEGDRIASIEETKRHWKRLEDKHKLKRKAQ